MSELRRRMLMNLNKVDLLYITNIPYNNFNSWRTGEYTSSLFYQKNASKICLISEYENVKVDNTKKYKISLSLQPFAEGDSIRLILRQVSKTGSAIKVTTIDNQISPVYTFVPEKECETVKITLSDFKGIATFIDWKNFLDNFYIRVEEMK